MVNEFGNLDRDIKCNFLLINILVLGFIVGKFIFEFYSIL